MFFKKTLVKIKILLNPDVADLNVPSIIIISIFFKKNKFLNLE